MSGLPFTIGGTIVRGKRLGTELGFPTANLDYPSAEGLPENGVYVAEAMVQGRCYCAILNQGHHPTAPEGRPTIETHLLCYDGGDLYGQPVTLCYRQFLRPETRFPSLAGLQAQLTADASNARRWTQTHRPILPGADGFVGLTFQAKETL